MNCVYHAYEEHLAYLGIKASHFDFLLYSGFKTMTGATNQFTYGGCVPWLLGKLAGFHNCHIVVECRIPQTKDYYEAHCNRHRNNLFEQWVVNNSDFGRETLEITLQPAIYLCVHDYHAVFREMVPSRLVGMAIQIRRNNGY